MKFSRMREIKALPAPSTPSNDSSSQETGANITASLLAKYTQLPYSENGDIPTDASSSYIGVSQDGSTLNVSSASFSPGMTNAEFVTNFDWNKLPNVIRLAMLHLTFMCDTLCPILKFYHFYVFI